MPVSQIRKLRTSPLIQTQELYCRGFQKLFLAAPRSFVTSFMLRICVLDLLFSIWVLPHTQKCDPKLLAINKEQGIRICKLFALLKNIYELM